MTEIGNHEILAALAMRHSPPERWAFFRELRIGTGYGKGVEQRLDAWAMSLWPSTGQNRFAYEVKISRGDFRREIKQPLKRRMGLLYSNYFYFATPSGLLKPEEIPPECGLIEVEPVELDDWHRARWPKGQPEVRAVVKVPAPHRDTAPPGWMFLASIARRAMRESA